jgi:hypothetical protein
MFPFNEKVYLYLKWLAAVAFPAVVTFEGACGLATGWEHTDVTVTVTAAVGALIGALVAGSAASYNKLNADPLEGMGNDVSAVKYDTDKGAATLEDMDWSQKQTDLVGEEQK